MPTGPSAQWLSRLERLRQKRLKAYLAEDYKAASKVEPKIRRLEILARINGWKLPQFDEQHDDAAGRKD